MFLLAFFDGVIDVIDVIGTFHSARSGSRSSGRGHLAVPEHWNSNCLTLREGRPALRRFPAGSSPGCDPAARRGCSGARSRSDIGISRRAATSGPCRSSSPSAFRKRRGRTRRASIRCLLIEQQHRVGTGEDGVGRSLVRSTRAALRVRSRQTTATGCPVAQRRNSLQGGAVETIVASAWRRLPRMRRIDHHEARFRGGDGASPRGSRRSFCPAALRSAIAGVAAAAAFPGRRTYRGVSGCASRHSPGRCRARHPARRRPIPSPRRRAPPRSPSRGRATICRCSGGRPGSSGPRRHSRG